MKLLIITQKYDYNDSNLGAFMQWWDRLSQRFDKVYILALEKRSEPQSPSTEVFSMGKEMGFGKIGRLWNFYKNLFKILPKTDAVFIHMIPLYLILAWLPAKIFGNKIVMWYAGVTTNNQVRLAVWLSDKTLTSQEGALRLKSPKRLVIGHGIDVDRFQILDSDSQTTGPVNILSVGRITPSKGHDLAIRAISDLAKSDYDLNLKIIGGVIQSQHQEYLKYLKNLSQELGIADRVEFIGAVSYTKMPQYYNRSQVLINAVPAGGFDKVILEAMASGVIPLTSNEYLKSVFPENLRNIFFFKKGDRSDLSKKLQLIIDKKLWQDKFVIMKLRNIVIENYSLGRFIDKLFHIFQGLILKNEPDL